MATRCIVHDLALGPDGRCALCLRSAAPRATLQAERSPLLGTLLGAFAALAFGALAWLALQEQQSVAAPPIAAEPAAAPTNGTRQPLEATSGETRDADGQAQQLAAQIAQLEAEHAEAAARTQEQEQPRAQAQRAERGARDDEGAAAGEPRAQRAAKGRALDAAIARVKITMYSTSWCPHCVRAKVYMQERGMRFTEHDVEQDREAAARRDVLNPRRSVPTIQIDDRVMVGFDPEGFQAMVEAAARRQPRR